jgi:hypothetical protein
MSRATGDTTARDGMRDGGAMTYTLSTAAKATGRNKSTIHRAIKSGAMSATRDPATGSWLIEPAELHRVYPPLSDATSHATGPETARDGARDGDATAQLLARLADKDAQIADLQRRLDAEAAERRQAIERLLAAQEKITALTDQRLAAPAAPAKRGWWSWRR